MPNGANWFIALPVAAEQLPHGVLAGLPAELRPIEPADLHVTVAFLGAVDERRALAAWSEIAEASEPARPFGVPAGRMAPLGNPRRPSAYGLDLAAEDTFTEWLGHWRDRLRAAAEVEPETRAVRPHVTLARPPRRAGPAVQRRAREWLEAATRAPTVLRLDRIALYTAAEAPGRQRYRRVRERPLGCAGGGD